MFAGLNIMLIFAPVKRTKENENNDRKNILVVALITTPTVVREQCSYVYTSKKILQIMKESCRNLRQDSFFYPLPQ